MPVTPQSAARGEFPRTPMTLGLTCSISSISRRRHGWAILGLTTPFLQGIMALGSPATLRLLMSFLGTAQELISSFGGLSEKRLVRLTSALDKPTSRRRKSSSCPAAPENGKTRSSRAGASPTSRIFARGFRTGVNSVFRRLCQDMQRHLCSCLCGCWSQRRFGPP